MMTKIAILHGGPADRVQQVVEHFVQTIYWAINEPIRIGPTHTRAELDSIDVRQARYEQVMAPVNPTRDYLWGGLTTFSRFVPDQEVALYVYIGEKG